MKISEISNAFPREEFVGEYSKYFDDESKIVNMPNGTILKVSHDDSLMHLGVFADDVIVAYVSMHHTDKFWQVDFTTTAIEYRGQGFIRYCIEYVVQHFGEVISDHIHTPDAKAMWQSLITRPNILKYYVYNTVSGQKIAINTNHDTMRFVPNPWEHDSDDEVVLVGLKESYLNILKLLKEAEIRNKKRGRHPSAWLGPGFKEYNP